VGASAGLLPSLTADLIVATERSARTVAPPWFLRSPRTTAVRPLPALLYQLLTVGRRAPPNDRYAETLQVRCRTRSGRLSPQCDAFDIRRSPDLCGFCSRQACLRFCGRKAHRCYSRANTLTALRRTPVTAAAKVPVLVACVMVGIECSGYLQLNGKPGRNHAAVRRSGVSLERAANRLADVCRSQVAGMVVGHKDAGAIVPNENNVLRWKSGSP
jgi:hypothetical protein